MMQKPPLDLSYIVRLQIDNRGKAIRHSWLHPVLTSLPRLQYLYIKLDSRRTFSFHSGPAPPTPLRPLKFVQIEGYYVLHRYKDAFDLSQYFANAKSIAIKAVRADTHFDEDLPVNRDLAPRSVYICGDGPMFLRPWIKIYSEPTAVHAIRHLRLAFRDYSHPHRAGFVSFLRSLSHLETIEFDFFTALNMSRWALTPIETQCRVIEDEVGPAFPHTLHTLCLRLPEVPWQKCAYWDVCLSLLKAVPDTIQHVEVRVSECNKYFGVEPFARSLKRLSGLRTLQVVLDEKEVMEKSVEDIAEYRAFLCNGFPELAAQGALRLSAEIRTVWQDSA